MPGGEPPFAAPTANGSDAQEANGSGGAGDSNDLPSASFSGHRAHGTARSTLGECAHVYFHYFTRHRLSARSRRCTKRVLLQRGSSVTEGQKPRRDDATHLYSAKDLYGIFGASVVAVITVDQSGDQGIGTAFHIGEGTFVTAAHVVSGKKKCSVALDDYRIMRLSDISPGNLELHDRQSIPFSALPHPDSNKDVAVFSIPALSQLPSVPLGDHLDDWITDHDFVLDEVLVLGFPPIPLAASPILVAARGQINAVVDLINLSHVHFVVSTMARGGFSGGVVLSERGFALGLVTSSLLKNGTPEELGYLTVLTVEPILECLGQNGLLTQELALIWDGLFTAEKEYFGNPEVGHAHSWIETDLDGHRARIIFATPSMEVVSEAKEAVLSLEEFSFTHSVKGVDVQVWEVNVVNGEASSAINSAKEALRALMEKHSYLPVSSPGVIDRKIGVLS